MDQPLMTTQQVADHLGVPVATLYQWRHQGTAPRALKVGKHVRYRRSDVEAWVTARLESAQEEER